MNKYMNELYEQLKENNFRPFKSDEDENSVWFRARLIDNDAAPLFYVSYTEDHDLVIMVSQLFKVGKPRIPVFMTINSFNADPASFGCKMFVDSEGDLIVNVGCFIETEDVVPQINEHISIVVASIDRYYKTLENVIMSDE